MIVKVKTTDFTQKELRAFRVTLRKIRRAYKQSESTAMVGATLELLHDANRLSDALRERNGD